MIYPYITQTKLQVRISFLEERYRSKRNAGYEREYDENGEWLRKQKAEKDALRRAKVAVVDYALNNDFEYFGTFTFSDKLVDIHSATGQKEALDKLLRFLDNYRQSVSEEFRYIIIPEYGGKKGRLHFHFLIKGIKEDDLFINEHHKLDFAPYRVRFGFCQITKIGNTDNDKRNVSFYCAKYVTKHNIQLRSHRYFCSKDLKKPTKYCMDNCSFVVTMQEWLFLNGFEAYYKSAKRKATCFSIPARVYFDMLKELGFVVAHGCVLYDSDSAFHIAEPFFELPQRRKLFNNLLVGRCLSFDNLVKGTQLSVNGI